MMINTYFVQKRKAKEAIAKLTFERAHSKKMLTRLTMPFDRSFERCSTDTLFRLIY